MYQNRKLATFSLTCGNLIYDNDLADHWGEEGQLNFGAGTIACTYEEQVKLDANA